MSIEIVDLHCKNGDFPVRKQPTCPTNKELFFSPFITIKPPFITIKPHKTTIYCSQVKKAHQVLRKVVRNFPGCETGCVTITWDQIYVYMYVCIRICIYVYMYTYICIYLLGSTYKVILIIYWFIYHNSPTFFLVIFRMGSIGTVGSMGDPQVSIGWFHGFFPSIDD